MILFHFKRKRNVTIILILSCLTALICTPINITYAQVQNISATKLVDEPSYKETLFIIVAEDDVYHVLVKANISKFANETLIYLEAILLNPHNSSLTVFAAISDILTDHPFIGRVEAIHFHIPENYVEYLVYYVLPIAIIVTIIAQVYMILSDISQYALNILLNQAPFIWASIPYVLYTLLISDTNNDDTNRDYYRLGSFDLYVPYLPIDYHANLVREGHYYIATSKSWWEIIKCEVYITIFGYRIVLFTYYVARFIKSRVIAPPKKPPIASFTWKPTYPMVGEEVLFTSTSFDPDGIIVSHHWWLGDGFEELRANFTHVYLAEGMYNVTLQVTDNDGLTSTIILSIQVRPRAEARLSVIPDHLRIDILTGRNATTKFVVRETLNQMDLTGVIFHASDFKNPDGYVISYENVYFDKNEITVSKGSYVNITVTFHAPISAPFGWYNGNITVVSDNGGTATIFVDLYVFGPPTANFTWSPKIPKVGEMVIFDASISLPSLGSIVSYKWNFGDGTEASGKIVSHIYYSAGTYVVTLNITDAEGLWDVEQKQIQVVQPHGPDASFIVTPETAKVGDGIEFDASSSTAGWNGTHIMSIIEYRWDFGDGNKTTTTIPIVHHSFRNPGIYYVTLTVYAPGASPETDSVTRKVIVISIPVGGYSFPINVQAHTKFEQISLYSAIIALSVIILTKERLKNRRGHYIKINNHD